MWASDGPLPAGASVRNPLRQPPRLVLSERDRAEAKPLASAAVEKAPLAKVPVARAPVANASSPRPQQQPQRPFAATQHVAVPLPTTEVADVFADFDAKPAATSRGLQRNSQLQWRSVRGQTGSPVQPTAHEDGPALGAPSGSVLKNTSAAPMPQLNPLDDPFGDRLAKQPGLDDDNGLPGDQLPALGEDEGPGFEDDTAPPAKRTPAVDDQDPFGDDPVTDDPGTGDVVEDDPMTDDETRSDPEADDFGGDGELAAPRELPVPGRPLTSEELRDQKYREDLAVECDEGLEELAIKKLSAVDLHTRLDIAEKGTALDDYPISCPVGNDEFIPRSWEEMYIAWTASGLCHKPLYFEERHLERYGHSTGPYTQGFVSMAHFFGSVAVLPYSMGLKTPNECVYALGHYRPGDCARHCGRGIPFTPRAALYQATAVAGVIAILP
ncbi:MAG: hypothetical protein DWQ31_11070 [Planctomycetota bacterium]|nr:MAG: hypothetical protein DWQ31_11070 [Planctomycetota bacterium]